MFDVAIKASNDDLRELQDQWTSWRKDHPSPVQTFLTSLWPTELASQALLDAVLPAGLKGQAPARVADADAAAFLASQLRTTGANELVDSHAVLTLPNECHLSGPSRLAFVVPTCPAKPLPLSRAALTDWSGFDLHVVRRAVRWHDDKPQAKNRKKATLRKVDQILAKLDFAVSGTVSIDDWMSMVVKDAKEPGVLQTALELPSRLIMSPAQDVRWVTPRGLPPDIARRFDPERNAGIWQAEFFETDADEPSLRAVWSRDFRRDAFTDPVQNHPPSPGAWAPWAPEGKVPFRTSVDALDRHELVGLTSLYGLPVLARRDPDGTLDATQARIPDGLALKDLKNKNDVALYLPQGLAPRRLALSSLGASLDLDASFTPPATAYRGRGPGKDTELFNSFSLARFSMQTSYGYDEVVEVVRKGFLMPLGHTAAFVKTTRREIWDQGAGPLAYPVQRLTVQVTKAEQLYGRTGQRDQGRGFPARSIELVTLHTPDLIDPLLTAAPAGTTSDAPLTHNAVGRVGGMVGGGTANTGQTGRATSGLVFWPRTQPNEAGNVRFRMRIDGSADTVYMPFGFEVARDRRVTLPRRTVVPLRIDGLPAPTDGAPGRHRLTLESLQAASWAGTPGATAKPDAAAPALRVVIDTVFATTGARLLKVTPVATGRHANLMHPDKATPSEKHALNAAAVKGESIQIWLPATERPAPPVIHDVEVRFGRTNYQSLANGSKTVGVRQATHIRVRLARPWYSSGEGERLGLVLWPPSIFFQNPRSADESGRPLPLTISDLDLGPVGPFITRWAADSSDAPGNWLDQLVPATAFTAGDDDPASRVTTAFMPLPSKTPASAELTQACPAEPGQGKDGQGKKDDDQDTSKKASVAGDPPPDFAAVALLTAEPRFDVEQELWFVDLELHAEELFDPYLRLGLVRYQPNAREDAVPPEGEEPVRLRVSTPVSAPARVLPTRAAEVTWRKGARGGTDVYVTVRVSRPVAGNGDRPGAAVRVRLLARRKDAASLNGQQVTAFGTDGRLCVWESWSGSEDGTMTATPGATAFTCLFNLPGEAEDDRWSHVAVVETFSRRPPANYPNEPVPDGDATLIESGPDFHATLELTTDGGPRPSGSRLFARKSAKPDRADETVP